VLDHARHIHDRETDVRRIHDHFARAIVLFYCNTPIFYICIFKWFSWFVTYCSTIYFMCEKFTKS